MNKQTVKLLVFIVMLVHGIGHLQGVVGSLGVKFKKSSSNVSWLLKNNGESLNKYTCLSLYLVSSVLGIFAALSFKSVLIPHSAWQPLMLITAIISSIALILFPRSLAMFFNKVGAIAVNLITYYSLMFNGEWPGEIFED